MGGISLLNVVNRPLRDWNIVVKDMEDRGLAVFLLFLCLPLIMIVALAIKFESRGPVLFWQNRRGFNNEIIRVCKFRTMRDDFRDEDGEVLTKRNDPRVTRVGNFLRRSSIDELPQLLNVLKGEMSIVGPRPHAISAKAGGKAYDQAVMSYAARHRVKPGITGWAQINGWRGETDTIEKLQRRVEHDLYYIEHWSVIFDLKILSLTPIAVLKGRNAV
jgi:exopolysaccharide biosynthesis polyprenyl glycosylphosphotransferase